MTDLSTDSDDTDSTEDTEKAFVQPAASEEPTYLSAFSVSTVPAADVTIPSTSIGVRGAPVSMISELEAFTLLPIAAAMRAAKPTHVFTISRRSSLPSSLFFNNVAVREVEGGLNSLQAVVKAWKRCLSNNQGVV